MGKDCNQWFNPGIHTGKLTEDKIVATRDAWVRYLARSLPGCDIVDKTKYTFVAGPGDAAPGVEEV